MNKYCGFAKGLILIIFAIIYFTVHLFFTCPIAEVCLFNKFVLYLLFLLSYISNLNSRYCAYIKIVFSEWVKPFLCMWNQTEVMLIGYVYFSYIKRRKIIHRRTKRKNLEELSVYALQLALFLFDPLKSILLILRYKKSKISHVFKQQWSAMKLVRPLFCKPLCIWPYVMT